MAQPFPDSLLNPIAGKALNDATYDHIDHHSELEKILVGPTVFNVKGYGATGDGSTNDTVAIQAAVDAASAGSVIYFPPGKYVFSSLVISKSLHFMGVGHEQRVNAALGDAAYSSQANFAGSLLISSATSGVSFDFHDASAVRQYRMTGLAIIGPGSGTSTGLRVKNSAGSRLEDVHIANFSVGLDIDDSLDSRFDTVKVRGCSTGIKVQGASNQNTWTDTEVQYSTVDGISVTATHLNTFRGGLLQNISGTAAIRVFSTAQNHAFDDFWFESITATNAVKFGPTGVHGCSLNRPLFASNGGTISIEANLTVVSRVRSQGSPGGDITITSGTQNTLIAIDNVTVTDSGTSTTRLDNALAKLPAALIAGAIEIDGALNHDGTTAGFFAVTPVTRPTAYTQTFATADKTHSADGSTAVAAADAVSAPAGGTGAAEGAWDTAVNRDAAIAVINSLVTLANETKADFNLLRTTVDDLKQLVNAMIDDDQALGLKQ